MLTNSLMMLKGCLASRAHCEALVSRMRARESRTSGNHNSCKPCPIPGQTFRRRLASSTILRTKQLGVAQTQSDESQLL